MRLGTKENEGRERGERQREKREVHKPVEDFRALAFFGRRRAIFERERAKEGEEEKKHNSFDSESVFSPPAPSPPINPQNDDLVPPLLRGRTRRRCSLGVDAPGGRPALRRRSLSFVDDGDARLLVVIVAPIVQVPGPSRGRGQPSRLWCLR